MTDTCQAIGAFALGNLLPAVTCMHFYDNAKLYNGCDNPGFTYKYLWALGQKQKCQTSDGRIVCIVSAIE